jgi:hypothetical protein
MSAQAGERLRQRVSSYFNFSFQTSFLFIRKKPLRVWERGRKTKLANRLINKSSRNETVGATLALRSADG